MTTPPIVMKHEHTYGSVSSMRRTWTIKHALGAGWVGYFLGFPPDPRGLWAGALNKTIFRISLVDDGGEDDREVIWIDELYEVSCIEADTVDGSAVKLVQTSKMLKGRDNARRWCWKWCSSSKVQHIRLRACFDFRLKKFPCIYAAEADQDDYWSCFGLRSMQKSGSLSIGANMA